MASSQYFCLYGRNFYDRGRGFSGSRGAGQGGRNFSGGAGQRRDYFGGAGQRRDFSGGAGQRRSFNGRSRRRRNFSVSARRWLALAVVLFLLGQWIGGGSLNDDGKGDVHSNTQTSPQTVSLTGLQTGRPPETELWVDILDCGQADTTLIRQGTHAMLFDCGAAIPMQVRQYLAAAGVERLEMVWLSHADADHIGAFPSVAYAFPVGRVFVNGESKDTASWSQLQEAIHYGNIPVQIPSPGEEYFLGDAQITVLGPLRYCEDNPNNNSLAVRISFGGHSFLFCGDAQEEEEMDMVSSGMPVGCDVLHVNHHGSSDASCVEFLSRAHPAWTVISCGRENDYGHPHGSTLRRLSAAGAQILRTDESGTVRFLSDGESLRIETER